MDAALVCMPFQSPALAPLAIPLLASVLRERGYGVAELYLNLDFAKIAGVDRVLTVSEGGTKLGFAAEFLFAEAYWGSAYEAASKSVPGTAALTEELFGTPPERAALLAKFEQTCLRRIMALRPKVVGFTTSTNQLMPSLWLARLVKRADPSIRIVFGGACCANPMGAQLKESYAQIDAVVSGYAESALVELMAGRGWGSTVEGAAEVVMDELPIPDYSVFVAAARETVGDYGYRLQFESSRGCWWGEKNHCTFCGLNQDEMKFRRKSVERVVSEVRRLWDQHGRDLFSTDTILALEHLKHALPALASYDDGPRLFYEIKANVSETEVVELKQARVDWVQPGIESLSSNLLRLLRKGVTSLQNVALLKWCAEKQVYVSWSILVRIPDEAASDYEHQLRLLSWLPHFQPPQSAIPVRVDRYSPYFQFHREFGWAQLEPFPEYQVIHCDMTSDQVRNVAYFFAGDNERTLGPLNEKRVAGAVQEWQQRNKEGDGLFLGSDGNLVRIDRGNAMRFNLTGTQRAVLAHTHTPCAVGRLREATGASEGEIAALEGAGVLYRERGRVVNLALRFEA